MYVRKFLAWAATAPTAERASAAAALARTLLDGELPKEEEFEGAVALASLADDSSPLVRRAIAWELAPRADAPRQIVVALAADQFDVSEPVLRYSPVLSAADLIDVAVMGDSSARLAIACRSTVPAPVCAALIEIGGPECVIALLDNAGADAPAKALWRVFERFPADAPVREALIARADLEPALRARLVDAAASALQDFVLNAGWMSAERAERATREAREKSFVIVAGEAGGDSAEAAVVKNLRESGRLTAALLLRALLSGDRRLLECALAELTGVDRPRAAGLVMNCEGAAFAALYNRAGLPEALLPVFRFALAALAEGGASNEFTDGGLQRPLVERVLELCEKASLDPAHPVQGLLRRFHAESAREEAREFSAWIARSEVLAALESRDRAELDETTSRQLEDSPSVAEQSPTVTPGEIAVARALNLAA